MKNQSRPTSATIEITTKRKYTSKLNMIGGRMEFVPSSNASEFSINLGINLYPFRNERNEKIIHGLSSGFDYKENERVNDAILIGIIFCF